MNVDVRFCKRETVCNHCEHGIQFGHLLISISALFRTLNFHFLCFREFCLGKYLGEEGEFPHEAGVRLNGNEVLIVVDADDDLFYSPLGHRHYRLVDGVWKETIVV